MPIYEYDCPVCGRFEQIQKATDKALKACPMCAEKGKKSAIERVVSAAAFHLKGSGWYATDFKGGDPSICNTASNNKAAAKVPASPCAACPNAPASTA